jgi:hypothetical protein
VRFLLDGQAARQILGDDAVARHGQSEGDWHPSSDPLMSDARIALHLENLRAERQRRLTLALGLATTMVVLVLALPLAFVVYSTVRDQVAARRLPPAPALVDLIATPAPPLVTPPPPEPAPAPVAAFADLIREGGALADRRSPTAADSFEAALRQRPGDTEASYGLGYVQLQHRDATGARRNLCAALGGADEEVRREIRSLLEQNQLSCTP